MRVIMGLAAAMMWTTPAMATDWFLVGTSQDDEIAVLVDRDSILDMGGNMRRATTYQVVAATEADGSAAYEASVEFDCIGRRFRYLHLKSVGDDGRSLQEEIGSGIWRPVKPGTLDDSQHRFVCSGGTDPSSAERYGTGPLIAPARAQLATQDKS